MGAYSRELESPFSVRHDTQQFHHYKMTRLPTAILTRLNLRSVDAHHYRFDRAREANQRAGRVRTAFVWTPSILLGKLQP